MIAPDPRAKWQTLQSMKERGLLSGGPFDFIGTDKKVSGNFPGLATKVAAEVIIDDWGRSCSAGTASRMHSSIPRPNHCLRPPIERIYNRHAEIDDVGDVARRERHPIHFCGGCEQCIDR